MGMSRSIRPYVQNAHDEISQSSLRGWKTYARTYVPNDKAMSNQEICTYLDSARTPSDICGRPDCMDWVNPLSSSTNATWPSVAPLRRKNGAPTEAEDIASTYGRIHISNILPLHGKLPCIKWKYRSKADASPECSTGTEPDRRVTTPLKCCPRSWMTL